jgi:hypothetical protein
MTMAQEIKPQDKQAPQAPVFEDINFVAFDGPLQETCRFTVGQRAGCGFPEPDNSLWMTPAMVESIKLNQRTGVLALLLKEEKLNGRVATIYRLAGVTAIKIEAGAQKPEAKQ